MPPWACRSSLSERAAQFKPPTPTPVYVPENSEKIRLKLKESEELRLERRGEFQRFPPGKKLKLVSARTAVEEIKWQTSLSSPWRTSPSMHTQRPPRTVFLGDDVRKPKPRRWGKGKSLGVLRVEDEEDTDEDPPKTPTRPPHEGPQLSPPPPLP